MRPNPTLPLAHASFLVLVTLLTLWTASVHGGQGTIGAESKLAIRVLSGQPHLVSGGDALIRIVVPDGTPLSTVTVSTEQAEITSAFHEEPGRHALLGLVTGLVNGNNRLTATTMTDDAAGVETAHLDLTNYPVTGPMISGPHEQPFHCQSGTFEVASGELLGPPLDADCSVETRVDYVYRATDGTFKPLPDPIGSLPDLTQTTTTSGQTVPFIVRVETGTVNRAIYESAILHDPRESPPDPWTRIAGWNGRLIYTHGGGCQSGWYQQGNRTGGVLRDGLLQDGYAVTSASLNVFGQNCNDLLASETHMMVKERFVERYGPPLFTIGTGGSGGSYQSHQTADNYPGVFDGIIVRSSFPDVTSATIFTVTDARLLHHYFTEVAPGTFTKEAQRAVAGFREWGNLPRLSRSAARIDPIFDEGLSPEEQGGEVSLAALEAERYHPVTNPSGARPTVYDHTVNVYGIDAETGFAGRPLDNVGVQYGLSALNAGQITPTQFLDLNRHIGGFDANAKHVATRHVANPHAARRALETGRILHGGGGLATTPVIDYRTYTDDREAGDIHMKIHQHSTRARMVAANGHAKNHVMAVQGRWGFTSDEPDLRMLFHQMDTWLTTLGHDTSDAPAVTKVVQAKPADLVDTCWEYRSEQRVKIDEPQTFDGPGRCNELYPAFPTPRHVAGAPLPNNIVKCQLKPVSRGDYAVPFTAEEWDLLNRVFPTGVCDWSQPGRYQGHYRGTWLSFGPSPVNLVQ